MTGETGWGHDPLPALSPEPPQGAPPKPSKRGSRFVGDTLGSTAAVSAALSWFLVGFSLVVAYVANEMLAGTDDDPIAMFFVVLLVLAVVVPVYAVAGSIALVTLVASIPLAVAWFRQPDRPAWPGYVLLAGLPPWIALIVAGMLLFDVL